MTKTVIATLAVLVLVLMATATLLVGALTADTPIPQQAAVSIAQQTVPGHVSEVELGTNYEVEVQTGETEQEVTINAQTGDVLNVEEEDEAPDVPITGTALEMASAAALKHMGQGRVTDTEVGDEDGYYEIEITLDNGQEVDVHLDELFNVISTEYD